jgi:hypothetical protein
MLPARLVDGREPWINLVHDLTQFYFPDLEQSKLHVHAKELVDLNANTLALKHGVVVPPGGRHLTAQQLTAGPDAARTLREAAQGHAGFTIETHVGPTKALPVVVAGLAGI